MSGEQHILVVGDDPEQRMSLASGLAEASGFSVLMAKDADQAVAKTRLHEQHVDAIVIDLAPGEGAVACRHLRSNGVQLPVILLATTDDENESVCNLDAGANDHVVKPVRLGELTARLRAHMRAFAASEDAALIIGPYQSRTAPAR